MSRWEKRTDTVDSKSATKSSYLNKVYLQIIVVLKWSTKKPLRWKVFSEVKITKQLVTEVVSLYGTFTPSSCQPCMLIKIIKETKNSTLSLWSLLGLALSGLPALRVTNIQRKRLEMGFLPLYHRDQQSKEELLTFGDWLSWWLWLWKLHNCCPAFWQHRCPRSLEDLTEDWGCNEIAQEPCPLIHSCLSSWRVSSYGKKLVSTDIQLIVELLLTQMAQRSRHSVGLWTMSPLEARIQFFHRQEGESLLGIYSPLCRQR